MDLITIDFETTYGGDYTLSKMTTEAYVRDPRFETILCSFKINSHPPFFIPGPSVASKLKQMELHKHAVCLHHGHFDALILSHHYGIYPKVLIDTLGMARALHGANGRLSLDKLAERYEIGQKGKEVHNVKGMRYKDFSQEALMRYGAYGMQDVELTYQLAIRMMPQFSREELEINDRVIRMFTEPVLELDAPLLQEYADGIRAQKLTVMMQAGVSMADLMSNEKFAECLRTLGVDPPLKISPTWLKKTPEDRKGDGITYAFAKTDAGMQALQEHPDERVQILTEARLANKTTIAEKGAMRLVEMNARGPATVYLKYAGASGTWRCSGGDKFNWQSMKRGSDLRNATMAPVGQSVVVGDSANIEARVLDWLAGQDDMVQVYRDYDAGVGPDVYCVTAERIYHRPISKANDPNERQMGKTCIAEGTPVLCYTGWRPIEEVAFGDRVWDGEEWVWAQGSVCNGSKPTVHLCGIWLTPDHLVWSGSEWKEARYLVRDEKIRSLSLATAAGGLPSRDISAVRHVAASRQLSYDATADALNTQWTYTTSKTSEPHGATYAPYNQVRARAKDIGGIWISSQTTPIGRGYSTVSRLRLADATCLRRKLSPLTEGGALQCAMSGAKTAGSFYGSLLLCQVGTTLRSTWTGSTITTGIGQVMSGLLAGARMLGTDEASGKCSAESTPLRRRLRVYDVVNCGPRNRFTVMTEEGPLIVHNCKLGLGFGMGADKFILSVRKDAKGADGKPLIITKERSQEIVKIYRDAHPQVKKLWKRCGEALTAIANGGIGLDVDYQGIVKTCKDGLLMPGGIKILFPDLKYVKDSKNVFGGEWSFWNGKMREHIYDAKLCENIVQCLARIIVMSQCLITSKELEGIAKWAHSVHDEGVFVTHDFYAPYVRDKLLSNMRIPPAWCPSLPLNSEGGFHRRYGKAKK